MISGKRGEFGSDFFRNRGLFKVKASEKGGIFLTWRTLMGPTKSLRVGVPGDRPPGIWVRSTSAGQMVKWVVVQRW